MSIVRAVAVQQNAHRRRFAGTKQQNARSSRHARHRRVQKQPCAAQLTVKTKVKSRIEERRVKVNEAASSIRKIIHVGAYVDHDTGNAVVAEHIRASVAGTHLVSPDAQLATPPQLPISDDDESEFVFRQTNPCNAAYSESFDTPVGLLNSTSTKYSSFSFLRHEHASPEAALLRSSTFDAIQNTPAAVAWYRAQRATNGSTKVPSAVSPDSLLVSPRVCLIRDSLGRLVQPRQVTVVTSAELSSTAPEDAVRARASRILSAFVTLGLKTIVLDTLGANRETAARVWRELLALDDAPFRYAFERVVIVVPGVGFEVFEEAWDLRKFEDELTAMLTED